MGRSTVKASHLGHQGQASHKDYMELLRIELEQRISVEMKTLKIYREGFVSIPCPLLSSHTNKTTERKFQGQNKQLK